MTTETLIRANGIKKTIDKLECEHSRISKLYSKTEPLTKEELETLAHETAKAVNLECRKLDRLLKMLKELENEQSDI